MFQDKTALRNGPSLAPETLAELNHRLIHGQLLAEGTGTPVTLGPAALERLLPHRPPMLLVDAIEEVDPAGRLIRGHRHLSTDDPGFAGHFPGHAVYPGTLVVEAIGQLAVALLHFSDNWTVEVPHDVVPPLVRAVHIHDARFIVPFVPGDTMLLHAHLIDNGPTIVAAGQAWKNGALAAYVVSELSIDDTPAANQQHSPVSNAQIERPSRRRHAGGFGNLTLEGFLD